jgi:hypothetical protein
MGFCADIARQVVLTKRTFEDFDDGEFGRCDGCRVVLSQFDPFTKHFASP